MTTTTFPSSLFRHFAQAIPNPHDMDVLLCPVVKPSKELSESFVKPETPLYCGYNTIILFQANGTGYRIHAHFLEYGDKFEFYQGLFNDFLASIRVVE